MEKGRAHVEDLHSEALLSGFQWFLVGAPVTAPMLFSFHSSETTLEMLPGPQGPYDLESSSSGLRGGDARLAGPVVNLKPSLDMSMLLCALRGGVKEACLEPGNSVGRRTAGM